MNTSLDGTPYRVVARKLRDRIISGRLPAGKRLPPRNRLAREFSASLTTVQDAIACLAEEGFVHTGARKHGTFVVPHPPHLHHYKIVFPYSPTTRATFWECLHNEAERLTAETADGFSFFYGLGGHRDIGAYREVVTDVLESRVAGLILASGATEFEGTPVLDQPNVPRVAVANSYELPGIPKFTADYHQFFARAIERLQQAGRRRIAVLLGPTTDEKRGGLYDLFRRAMAARGLPVEPRWVQTAGLFGAIGARQVLHLMFYPGQPERPDGLILSDDSSVEMAEQGLAEAGVRVPEDVMVVALANFPLRAAGPAGWVRLGFDVPAWLHELVAGVEALRAGRKLPELTAVAPLFAEELR